MKPVMPVNTVRSFRITSLIIHKLLAELTKAYAKPFIGVSAQNFLEYLKNGEKTTGGRALYAKAVSVVQSSGTGKSRMLTEVRLLSVSTLQS
jgi:hypothetical protein